MARSLTPTLSRHSLSLCTGLLISLAHGIPTAYPTTSIDHRGPNPPPIDAAVPSLAVDLGTVLFHREEYNCTSWSLGSHGVPAWEIQNFSLDRFWNSDVTPSEFRDEVEFTYKNTAMNSVPHRCYDLGTRSNPLLDGSKVQRCDSGPRDLTHFSFDYTTMTLTLTQDWGCDAIDRQHANYFSATEKVVLPLKCATANGNETVCSMTDKISVPMKMVVPTLNSDPKDWDEGIVTTS